MFATYLQKDLQLSPGLVALPVLLMSIGQFGSGVASGWVADRLGRRWAMILPALIGLPLVPLYLFTRGLYDDRRVLWAAGMVCRWRHLEPGPELPRRALPDRGTRDGLRVLLSPGRDLGRPRRPVVAYFAVSMHLGFAVPMLIGTTSGLVSFILALLYRPETRGRELVADVVLA